MFQKKQIFKLNVLKKLLDDEHGCVCLVPSTRLLALPPFFLNDMKSGILYLLNCMLKKYDRSLGGIVIGYQNVKVLMDENTGIIPMGTPEMEVNISVEFYIFQPKIGSLLEGVVNKKSNNHIGCLVHQYFNATILKPEDVDFDDWICKDFNVDDKITFKVKDLDFTSLLPYIEGEIEENLADEGSDRGRNKISTISEDVQETSSTKELLNRICKNQDISNKLLVNKKEENESDINFGKGFTLLQNSIELGNDDSNDFVNPAKLRKEKKKKKKKKKDNETLNNTHECLTPKEDSVFCSTQLEPNSESKMMISFCSPIPRTTSSETREDEKGSTRTSHVSITQDKSSQMVGVEKERKRKRKRKTEEEDEGEVVPKKIKMSSASFTETNNITTKNPETEKMVEELYKQQVSRLMGDSNMSQEASFKKKKSPKKKVAKQKKEEAEESVLVEGENMSEGNSRLDELCERELNALNGKDNSAEKKPKEESLNKLLKGKRSSKAQLGEVSTSDKLHKEVAAEKSSKKERKKSKSLENKREVSRDRISDSLYKKLLKEARNAIDFENCQSSRNKKESELSDLSTSSSKKRNSRKKSKHKEKVKESLQTPDKYKNGNMYDMAYTPEKLNPDKSLFTDSEQSHFSPAKKRKELNGVENAAQEKSTVQKTLNEFWKEEMTRTKSETEKKIPKHSDKKEKEGKKSKENLQSSGSEKQSLYEKLLTQAKRLVDIKDSPSKEKDKFGNRNK